MKCDLGAFWLLGSHGQVGTVVSCFPGCAVVPRLCFLQAGHGGGALDVDDGVQLCPARGGGRQGRGGCFGGVRPARVRHFVHLHLDVVELAEPAEVEVKYGGLSAVEFVGAERHRDVLSVHVVVIEGMEAVQRRRFEFLLVLRLAVRFAGLPNGWQRRQVLVVEQRGPPLG